MFHTLDVTALETVLDFKIQIRFGWIWTEIWDSLHNLPFLQIKAFFPKNSSSTFFPIICAMLLPVSTADLSVSFPVITHFLFQIKRKSARQYYCVLSDFGTNYMALFDLSFTQKFFACLNTSSWFPRLEFFSELDFFWQMFFYM